MNSKESKLLLLALVVCTMALAGFQYWLHQQVSVSNMLLAQNMFNAGRFAAVSADNELAKQSASASASPSGTPAGKSASASATVRPRVTAAPTATPESTPEE